MFWAGCARGFVPWAAGFQWCGYRARCWRRHLFRWRDGSENPLGQFAVIFPFAVMVGVVGTMSEAYLLMPQTREIFVRQLFMGTVTDACLAAVLAMAAKIFVRRRIPNGSAATSPGMGFGADGAAEWVFVFGLFCGFGGITFVLFTRKYYPNLPNLGPGFGALKWHVAWR